MQRTWRRPTPNASCMPPTGFGPFYLSCWVLPKRRTPVSNSVFHPYAAPALISEALGISDLICVSGSSLSFLLSFCSTLIFLGVCSFLLFFGLLWSSFAASLWPVPLWLPLFSLLGANCAPAPFVCALFCLGLAVLGCALLASRLLVRQKCSGV